MNKKLTVFATAFLLLATIAQARPEWLYKPTNGLDGEYTEQRVKGFGYGTPSGAIYQGQDRKEAMRNVDVERVDIETGQTNAVTVSQVVPIAEAYYAIGMSEPREATEAEMAARAANVAAKAQTAATAAQLAKPLPLRIAENKFLGLCDQLTGSTNHTKLSFGQIEAIGDAITDEATRIGVAIKLLALDAELKREGGNNWWDDCEWHPELIGGGQ